MRCPAIAGLVLNILPYIPAARIIACLDLGQNSSCLDVHIIVLGPDSVIVSLDPLTPGIHEPMPSALAEVVLSGFKNLVLRGWSEDMGFAVSDRTCIVI